MLESVLAAVIAAVPPAHPCRAPLPHAPALPAPLIAWSSCGAFRVARDGSVERLPPHWLARHGGGTGRRFGAKLNVRRNRAGRYFLLRDGRLVWRSRGLYPNDGGSVAFGPGLFAFNSYRRGVFMTDLGGAERLVVRGRAIYPYDFTAEGDLIVVGGRELMLVARDGRVVARFAFRERNGFAFDGRTDTIFFVTRAGRLGSVRDRRLRLARRLDGVNGSISTSGAGLLVFQAARELVVARADGSVVARTRWHGRLHADAGLSVSSDGRRYAFRLSDLRPGAKSGTATVYVFGPRAPARRVYRHRIATVGCANGAGLGWHGHDLLYDSTDGRRAIVDVDTRRVVDLTALATRLPHRSGAEFASLEWASTFR